MRKIKTLKLNYEFKNVFTKGSFCYGNQVIGYILKNKYDYNRFGVAISKHLCKAVKRNRIKRVIRAAYQEVSKKEVMQGYDIVFIWNKNINIEELDYHIIEKDINKIFEKSGILNEKSMH